MYTYTNYFEISNEYMPCSNRTGNRMIVYIGIRSELYYSHWWLTDWFKYCMQFYSKPTLTIHPLKLVRLLICLQGCTTHVLHRKYIMIPNPSKLRSNSMGLCGWFGRIRYTIYISHRCSTCLVHPSKHVNNGTNSNGVNRIYMSYIDI